MVCNKCGETKTEEEFSSNRFTCRTCRNKYFKEHREANKEEHKCKRLQRTYGVTLKEYNELIEDAGECEICGKDNPLVYDHNHTTGKFRGVLCSLCNSALGHFKDSKANLVKAFKYLDERGSYGDT